MTVENVFAQLKKWGCCSHTWRHSEALQNKMWRIVAILTQMRIKEKPLRNGKFCMCMEAAYCNPCTEPLHRKVPSNLRVHRVVLQSLSRSSCCGVLLYYIRVHLQSFRCLHVPDIVRIYEIHIYLITTLFPPKFEVLYKICAATYV